MIPENNTFQEKERLEMALEAAGVGTWDLDLISQKLVWSHRCYQLFGINQPFPVTFDDFLKGLHPDDREKTNTLVSRAIKGEGQKFFEADFRTIGLQDGQLRWIRSTGKVYFQPSGTPYRFIGTVTDITHQKMAEQDLQESEARFRNMADNTPVMIWMTDEAGNCIYLNKRWLDATGQTPEEGYGMGWVQALHPEDREPTENSFLAANKEKVPFRCEYRLRMKDKTYEWMLDSAMPRFDSKGSFLGYIGSVLEITDRKLFEEKLQFRTALLEAQHESSASGLLTVDTKGKILSFNHRLTEIWKVPHQVLEQQDEHALLQHARTLLPDPQAFVDRVNYLYQTAEENMEEIELKDGGVLERTGRPVVGSNGTFYGWLWQFEDITERKRIQNELELRTALLEAQNEGSPLGVLVINQKMEIYYLNNRYAELFQLPASLVQTHDRGALLQIFQQTIRNYDAFLQRIEYLYAHPEAGSSMDEIHMYDGRIIERFGYAIKGKEGAYLGWTWQFRDITAQRTAEAGLQQKNKELERLIQEFKFVTDFMPQMVWATRPDGYHDFFNKQWYDYTGLTFEQTKADGWSLVLHPDDFSRTLEVWRHSLETGEVYEIEYRMRRHDGAYRWFLARAIPMYNAVGEIEKWFGTCTDIHDQRTTTDLLEQKVQERTYALQEANLRLERSNQELEQFAYVASHDLQEPLRKIRTFTNMLDTELKKEHSERVAYFVDRIWQSSSRMQDLIKDLLDFSRLNRAHQDAFEPTDLNEVVRNVTEDLELLITQKEAKITCDPLPFIEASPLQMSQLFYNLLSNAVKFSKTGTPPEVHISCKWAPDEMVAKQMLPVRDDRYLYLTISDNGIGFDPEYAQQIFTIFQRLHARSAYEGTGIGLALCKKVALNHKGQIWATAKPGAGATFHILLPEKHA